MLGQKNFGPKKILGPKKFWVQKVWGPKKCWVQKILVQKILGPITNSESKKIFGPKKCLAKKILAPRFFLKTIFRPKKFGSKIEQYLGPVDYGPKIFWPIQILGPKTV